MKPYLTALGLCFVSLFGFACSSSDSSAQPDDNTLSDAATDSSKPVSDAGGDSNSDAGSTDSSVKDGASAQDGATDALQDAVSEPVPCDGAIKINEILVAGPAGTDDSFVELYNPTSCAIQLDEVQLIYRTAKGATDQPVWAAISGQSLKAHTFFVLGGKNYSGNPDFKFNDGISLSTEGGGLALKKGTVTLDQIGWGTAINAFVDMYPAPAPLDKRSIGRIPDGNDTDNNQDDFVDTQSTPRAANKK
jgi:hypothetical protein